MNMKKVDFLKYIKENETPPNTNQVNSGLPNSADVDKTTDSVNKLNQSLTQLSSTMNNLEETEDEFAMEEEEITENVINPDLLKILAEAENPRISKKELISFVNKKMNK